MTIRLCALNTAHINIYLVVSRTLDIPRIPIDLGDSKEDEDFEID